MINHNPNPRPEWSNRLFFLGHHERISTQDGRTEMFRSFINIYIEGAETVLGADAHRGAFSEATSASFAGVDSSNPPHKLLDWLPIGSEPAEESVRSIERAIKNLTPPEEGS